MNELVALAIHFGMAWGKKLRRQCEEVLKRHNVMILSYPLSLSVCREKSESVCVCVNGPRKKLRLFPFMFGNKRITMPRRMALSLARLLAYVRCLVKASLGALSSTSNEYSNPHDLLNSGN